MLDFAYQNQTKIVFGKDSVGELSRLMPSLGKRALIVYGGGSCVRSGLLARVKEELTKAGLFFLELGGVRPNPRMKLAYEGIALCKEQKLDCIVAVGGGSVIDTAKTIGIGACYDGDVWDFFTGVQAKRTLPLGVVLTIPAAGSESSRDAVMTREEGLLKRASCAADFIRPVFSILNPRLTFTLSPYQTACGSCDIMAHVLERYFTNTPAVDVTDRLCEALLRSVIQATGRVLKAPEDCDARAEIMLAGTYAHNGIVGVGRAEDWASHGMGHEISALTDAAHGATLAVMFPAWMRYVAPQRPQRFAQLANRVFDVPYMPGQEAAMAEEGIRRFQAVLHGWGLPGTLKELGVSAADIPVMAAKCHRAGNFVCLNEEQIAAIYASVLG